MTDAARNVDLEIGIPPGYVSLPLDDIDSSITTAAAVLKESGPSDVAQAADQVLPALRAFLDELARDGVRYCGLGKHLSDDTFVTSVLTILVYDTGGDTENPRLVVKNLAEAKVEAGDRGDLQVIELDNRPMMFFEQVRDLPVPDFPGNPIEGTTAPVYRLEAVVPSDDGSAVASIELSTVFSAHGPQFRPMIIDMARSVKLGARVTYGGLRGI
ncbi:hypothetical protein IU494_09280 [Nocardia terpenica]|uniref:hypothetical protein n=1 Tax=Nocardia terpenica TaxID=455432 RepID=UPI0018938704|nr:hypothetical protein [Nocardia terpenica]MBF6060972.1 hypothetical protein [Nocardia terpenica]MBF6111394.1 hypothetical protein [Nocardia terpenica]MBF6118453.1 hypothetical protein [Nocardia terpenica]MBF6155775.1 hypothetical protein [Nocardia terpenica]